MAQAEIIDAGQRTEKLFDGCGSLGVWSQAPDRLKLTVWNRADLAVVPPLADRPSQGLVRLHNPDGAHAAEGDSPVPSWGGEDAHDPPQVAAVAGLDHHR